MHYEEDLIELHPNHSIGFRAWRVQKPDAAVLVIHGMAEHSGRYDRVGELLTEQNISLYAFDLPGHGENLAEDDLGQIASWDQMLATSALVWARVAEMEPRVPLFILGHSMGSYITLELIQKGAQLPLAGVIVSGSGLQNQLQLIGGLQLARFESFRLGPESASAILEKASFGQFNNRFKPNRTEFDWLSRNLDSVLAYIEDPYCGFRCSNRFWIEFLKAQIRLGKRDGMANIPAHLPMYLFSGDHDPVGRFGHGVTALKKKIEHSGIQNVELRLYSDGRHEMLNETNRERVVNDLVKWLKASAV